MDVDFDVDQRGIEETVGRYLRPWLEAKASSVAQEALRTCPVGAPDPLGRPREWPKHMRDCIVSGVDGNGLDLTGWVRVDTPYALAVHEGSKRHTIPTGGRAAQKAKGYPLRFGSKGMTIRAYEVSHPGNQPNRFLLNALTRVMRSSVGDRIM